MTPHSPSVPELLQKRSPFPGRTFISLYIPKDAPRGAVVAQLNNEITRTEQSTNWHLKGVLVMMFKQIIDFLVTTYPKTIPSPGFALFAVPLDHLQAEILVLKPYTGVIDLFTLNIEAFVYLNPDYLPIT